MLAQSEAENIFNVLAADGTVQVALQESLWAGTIRHAGRPIRHSVDQLWEALPSF